MYVCMYEYTCILQCIVSCASGSQLIIVVLCKFISFKLVYANLTNNRLAAWPPKAIICNSVIIVFVWIFINSDFHAVLVGLSWFGKVSGLWR